MVLKCRSLFLFYELTGQVKKRLEKTARYFKNLGTLGFWSQLVCTIVSGGILSFSTVAMGKVTAPFTFYATAAGIAAAFISVFWSFGYIRLSERLKKTAKEPAKVIFFLNCSLLRTFLVAIPKLFDMKEPHCISLHTCSDYCHSCYCHLITELVFLHHVIHHKDNL